MVKFQRNQKQIYTMFFTKGSNFRI